MNNAKIYTISVIFFFILFSLWAYPLQLISTAVAIFLGYAVIKKCIIPAINNANNKRARTIRRQAALRSASMFLVPYKNIWGNLKLTNKFCYLYLAADGTTIIGAEKKHPFRKFRVVNSHVHSYEDLWNMFCKNFTHNKTYDGLIEDSRLYQLSIYETFVQDSEESVKPKLAKTEEKLDINNCSEIEITELPLINIVMAKKVIKKREEIGGFKSVDEFFLFLKLKPHMEEHLRGKICVKKMKGSLKKISKNAERTVDL